MTVQPEPQAPVPDASRRGGDVRPDPSTFCPRDHGCSLPAGHDDDCELTAAVCDCAECEARAAEPVGMAAAGEAVETEGRDVTRFALPYPISEHEHGGACPAISQGWYCTRTVGHEGKHEAGLGDEERGTVIAASWPQTPQPVTQSPVRVDGEPFDLAAHLARQRAWSEATFGPGDRAKGVVAHIRKELVEVEADPGDVTEWIDVVILALDGAWRSGAAPGQIIDALVAKQARNEGRAWPDWRTADPDGPIEHTREAASS